MTAEQKERMKYEVEVQKARELKRIADALEIISGFKCPKERFGEMAGQDQVSEHIREIAFGRNK